MRNGMSCFEILPLPPGFKDPENIRGHLPTRLNLSGVPCFYKRETVIKIVIGFAVIFLLFIFAAKYIYYESLE